MNPANDRIFDLQAALLDLFASQETQDVDTLEQLQIMFSMAMLQHQLTTVAATLVVKLIAENRRQRAIAQQACESTIYRHLSEHIVHRSQRRFWMIVRSRDWWERVVLKEFTDTEWRENFRMTRGSFMKLCSKMHDVMKPIDTYRSRQRIVPLEMRVAIVLYKLGKGASYKTMVEKFGVQIATIHSFVYMFCKGISSFITDFISTPTVEEARQIAQQFQHQFYIPNVIGCIDNVHIPVSVPDRQKKAFVNGSGLTSYVLQGVVNDRYCFWNISCTISGSANDADVLKQSQLYKDIHALPKETMYIQGKPVDYYILGNAAHPLSDWLIKPYTQDCTLTAQQESFNAYVYAALTIAETAFGRLRARWRVLKKSDFLYTFTPYLAAACCALHNFCEWEEEPISLEWQEETRLEAAVIRPQPAQPPHTDSNIEGETIREALTEYLTTNFPFLKML